MAIKVPSRNFDSERYKAVNSCVKVEVFRVSAFFGVFRRVSARFASRCTCVLSLVNSCAFVCVFCAAGCRSGGGVGGGGACCLGGVLSVIREFFGRGNVGHFVLPLAWRLAA